MNDDKSWIPDLHEQEFITKRELKKFKRLDLIAEGKSTKLHLFHKYDFIRGETVETCEPYLRIRREFRKCRRCKEVVAKVFYFWWNDFM